LTWAATAASRTVKLNTWGMVPGMLAMASSPSHVLHTQPLRENFCT